MNTSTSVVTPPPTVIPSNTPELIEEGREIVVTSESPDGIWTASVVKISYVGSKVQTSLRVHNRSEAAEWQVDEAIDNFMSASYAWPFHWTQDGLYLYFTHLPVTSDGCFGAESRNGSDLWQLDLRTGEIVQIAPRLGSWLAISPDDKSIAYINQAWGFVIRELLSGNERSARLKIADEYPNIVIHETNITWSPDGKSLVFVFETNACDAVSHSIIKVDAIKLIQTTLLKEDNSGNKRLFKSIEWTNQNFITVMENNGNVWQLNPDTGHMIPLP